MSAVAVLVRSHFVDLRGATYRKVGPNVYEVAVPKTLTKKAKRGPRPEDWDGAVFFIDDVETEPAVGSGETATTVLVTVLTL